MKALLRATRGPVEHARRCNDQGDADRVKAARPHPHACCRLDAPVKPRSLLGRRSWRAPWPHW
eukprot:scaffold301614_cov28-Tisochrysis_lutea.AAC.5